MQPPVDWLPPIVMLSVGLVVGVIVAFFVARKGRASTAEVPDNVVEELSDLQLEIRDLEAKREDFIAQLREMEDTAVKRDPEQLAAERYALELETARVLRELDGLTGRMDAPELKRVAASGTAPVTEEPSGPPGGIKGFVWGVASAAAIGALVIFVAKSASERAEGGSVTGGPQMSGRPPAEQSADPQLQQAIAMVNAQPDNIQARVDLAYQYLIREQFMNVFEQTQLVLQRDPNEPRALTYQSLVRLAMGQSDLATDMLQRAIEVDPDFLDSRVYLALTYAQTGRFDQAMKEMDEAKTRHPDQVARLDEVIAELEARRALGTEAPPGEPAEDPHASLLPPPPAAAGSQPTATAPAAAPGAISGMITLGGGVTVQRGAPVFIIVREAGASTGPPVAVSRMVAGTFPMPFTVSAANSMMGDALPERMRVEVRIDLDGNAMTRDQGAPEGALDDVAPGASGLTITLR